MFILAPLVLLVATHFALIKDYTLDTRRWRATSGGATIIVRAAFWKRFRRPLSSPLAETEPCFHSSTSSRSPSLLAWPYRTSGHRQKTTRGAGHRIRPNHGPYRAEEITIEFVHKLRRLGFNTVVWGPVERDIWGKEAENALLAGARPIVVCGFVTAYQYGNAVNTDEA